MKTGRFNVVSRAVIAAAFLFVDGAALRANDAEQSQTAQSQTAQSQTVTVDVMNDIAQHMTNVTLLYQQLNQEIQTINEKGRPLGLQYDFQARRMVPLAKIEPPAIVRPGAAKQK